MSIPRSTLNLPEPPPSGTSARIWREAETSGEEQRFGLEEGCLGHSVTIVRHPGAVLTQREEEMSDPFGVAGPLLTDSPLWREVLRGLLIFTIGAFLIALVAILLAPVLLAEGVLR